MQASALTFIFNGVYKAFSGHLQIPPGNSHLSSLLQFSQNHNLVRADLDYLQRKLMAFSCQLLLQRVLS